MYILRCDELDHELKNYEVLVDFCEKFIKFAYYNETL